MPYYLILDTASVNAQTMLCLKERNDARKSKSFGIGFALAMFLVVPEIRRRPKVGLNKTVLGKMDAILNDDEDESNNDNANSFPKLGEKRVNHISGTDYKEKKAKLQKNKTQCQKCGVPCCPTHLLNICNKLQ